ncbi:MAG: pilus assembly protein PilM, partial [Candidatus Omnitrophota bacterium]
MNQDIPTTPLKKNLASPEILKLQETLGRGKSVIGIEIGFTSVNVAQRAIYQGKPTIIKVAVEKIIVTNEDQRESATVEALKKVLARFNTKNAEIICIVANPKTVIDHIAMPLMPVTELPDAVKLEVSSSQLFAIENPIIDFQLMGRIIDKGVDKNNVRVVATPKSSVDSLLAKFKPQQSDPLEGLKKLFGVGESTGINIVRIIPLSIAIENIIKKCKFKEQEIIATIEIGSMASELNVYRASQLEFSRKINVTGLDFTKSLTSSLFTDMGKIELTMEEAEEVKKEHGIPFPEEDFLVRAKITANQALSLLRPKLEQLAREINRSFDYYQDKRHAGKIDKLIMFGGGALLRRLPELLNVELGVPVQLGNPLQDVDMFSDT